MTKPILRCDSLRHAMNPGKERAVRELLAAWRTCAVEVGGEQRRLFFETGRVNKMHRSPVESDLARIVGAANRLQMVRHQVVGVLESFLANRQNEFARIVECSGLEADLKHRLHFVNRCRGWFLREPLTMKDGSEIPPEARALARRIMRRVLSRHRWPSFRYVGMVIDRRAATLREAEAPGQFPLWLRLSTMERGRRIEIPLRTHPYFEARAGTRKQTVQVSDKGGHLVVGVVTDVSEPFAESRAAYQPKTEQIALDFGLRTLFATDRGDLLGRRFIDRLRHYDARITRLAAYRQRHGLRTRSPRYDREVGRLRGFVESEVNRVLNRLVETHRPARIVVERLRFHNPNLSRRMNRLVSRCGRGAIRNKLPDLEERFGIEAEEVNPAYRSQTCSACDYVDRRNRQGEQFRCLWCGRNRHADVHAAQTLGARRSRPEVGSVKRTKAAILRAQVGAFRARLDRERQEGRRGTSRDPTPSNPYMKHLNTAEVTSNGSAAPRAHVACATGT